MTAFRSTWLTLILGVLAGLGLAVSVTGLAGYSVVHTPVRPTPTMVDDGRPFSPRIALQYYETGGIDTTFLAQHVDLLMLRFGAERLRDEVRSAGYRGPLLQYMLLFQITGPGPYENADERCRNRYTALQNNAMWTKDFCELVHPNEDWFLHNDRGERIITEERLWDGSTAYEYLMNPASPGYRAFWISQLQRQQEAGWDGIFLDNVAVHYMPFVDRADNGRGGAAEFRSAEQWQAATVGMLEAIRAAFPGRGLWGNIVEAPPTAEAWDRYRPLLDGIQEEHFAAGWVDQPPLPPETWLAMVERAERTLADGRSVMLYTQGQQGDFARARFGLASYLLVATPDKRATFRYAETTHYEQLWWYPEYELELGPPLGARYRDGNSWVREFACATVTVDPTKRSGSIERHDCRPRS